MIFGIGTDIIEIDRITKALEIKGFVERWFSGDERKLFANKPNSTIAANFAAKEAFSKALGTGIRGFSLNEISVLRDEAGKPYFKLSGNAERIANDLGIDELFVSLSHCKNYAIAYVLLKRAEPIFDSDQTQC